MGRLINLVVDEELDEVDKELDELGIVVGVYSEDELAMYGLSPFDPAIRIYPA